MNSEPFHPEAPAEPQHDAAVIRAVTPDMMDGVAQRAAALADGVAHHTIPHQAHVAEAPEATADEIGPSGGTGHPDGIAQAAEAAVAPVAEVAGAAVEAGGAVLARMADAAQETVSAARDAVSRTTAAAEPGLPGGVDALSRYNDKVLEMVRGSMASTTALFAALVQAKSVPDAVALNADHLRRQMETLTSQGRELANLAQTLALDALRPLLGRDR